MIDISIVIVSYNVKKYIISCIESIYKHSKSSYFFEIVIVDNNSKDETAKKIEKDFPEIKLIKNDYNAGFSVAANQGVKLCRGKYIFILNPDTVFVEDTLRMLINEANANESVGILGPKIIDKNGLVQRSFWRKPSTINTMLGIFHLDFLNYKKNYKDRLFRSTSRVETISGAAFFLQKEIYNKLNGFNEDLFWMEDIDFCNRVNHIGLNVFYCPQTKIIHYSGKSAKKNYKVAISNQMLSKIKYFKIYHSWQSTFLIKVSVLLASIIKSTAIFFILPFSKKWKSKMIAYLYTVRSVFKVE